MHDHPKAHSRRRVLKAGLHAVVGLGASWGSHAAAQVAGPVLEGSWTDSTRARTVPWRLRWPAGDQGAAVPLVLYSHGLGGNLDAGTVWGQAWAAAGFAVLHLQHAGSDTEALRGGLRAMQAAVAGEQLLARVFDVKFVLDRITEAAARGEAPWQRVLPGVIGLAGHSFGAQTTQAIAGQRYAGVANAAGHAPPAGTSDPRPRAFIAFSPSQPRGGAVPSTPFTLADSFGAVTRPFLAVTGSEDGDPFDRYEGGEPRAQVYQGLPPGQRALLWLDGADHMTFAGQELRRSPATGPLRRRGPAAERQAAHHTLLARATTDWWRAQLLGDAAARARLAPPAGLAALDRWQTD